MIIYCSLSKCFWADHLFLFNLITYQKKEQSLHWRRCNHEIFWRFIEFVAEWLSYGPFVVVLNNYIKKFQVKPLKIAFSHSSLELPTLHSLLKWMNRQTHFSCLLVLHTSPSFLVSKSSETLNKQRDTSYCLLIWSPVSTQTAGKTIKQNINGS